MTAAVTARPAACWPSGLSENPAHTVLLIDAGPRDTSPLIAMPKGFVKLLTDPAHARYTPVAQHDGDAHRQEVWARGKMLDEYERNQRHDPHTSWAVWCRVTART